MNEQKEKLKQYLLKWRSSPIAFIEDMWGITPQFDNKLFVKGEHLSKQQYEILMAVEKAIKGEAPKRISISSGHGIGKSTVMAWLLIWYLFCFKESQVGATAPTTEQMHDVLWKEVNKWLKLLPAPVKEKFEWSATHVRIKERPEVWFARAKTARKEAPEAFAGLHANYVMLLADEASGVADEIYRTAEGSLTDKNTLVVLISNYTRLVGYFHETHSSDKANWQTFRFSCIDSPLVDWSYVERIKARHGEDSDEYRIRVLGEPPKADAVDEGGYVPLFVESDLRYCDDSGPFARDLSMGIDPSGAGDDETVWVVRDNFRSKIAAVEKISTTASIAQKTLTLMKYYSIPEEAVVVDNFGEGANVAQELAHAGIFINGINVGGKPDDETYLNLRAELGWRAREWTIKGGQLVRNPGWKELMGIRFRRERSGKMKLKGKDEMRKDGIPSPNVYDAWSLTFFRRASPAFRSKLSDQELSDITDVY